MRHYPSLTALATAALALALLVTPLPASAGQRIVGSGHTGERSLDLDGIRGVLNTTPGDLEIRQGDAERLVISADDNLLDAVETNVEDGILTRRFRSKFNVRIRTHLRFTLTVKALEEIAITGSGDTHAETLDCPRLAVRLSGSGDVDLDALRSRRVELRLSGSGDVRVAELDAEDVETRLSGSGNVELRGKAGEQTLRISGSGNYSAERLGSRNARVSITGSGDGRVNVTDALEVSISGSGDLRYSGDPRVSTHHLSGSGSLDRI